MTAQTPYPSQTNLTADSIFVPVDYQSITASDTTVYAPMMRGVLVGGNPGTVTVVTSKGTTVALPGLVGQIIPGYFQQVRSTGTTATGLLAVY